MTATDELCRLLDEHGMEWSMSGVSTARWRVGDTVFRFDGWGDKLRLLMVGVTPAQAVEAMLVLETCEWVYQQGANGRIGYAECSECGYRVYDGTVDEKEWICCPKCSRRVVDGGGSV